MVPRHGHFHRCSRYVQSAIKNIDDCLAKQDYKLPAPPRANTPLPSNYSAEIDVSMELQPVVVAYFQYLIESLPWMVKLG
jgi:hypothetical protein